MNEQDLIGAIYTTLYTQVEKTGQDRWANLPGGIRLALGRRGPLLILTVRRVGGSVRTTDEVIIRHQCQVPSNAVRKPAAGQSERVDSHGATSHYLMWQWEQEPSNEA